MEKFYKIKPGTGSKIMARTYRQMLIVAIIVPVFLIGGTILSGETDAAAIFSIAVALLLAAGIFYVFFGLMVRVNEQAVYITDDDGIRRIMNVKEDDLNIFQKLFWGMMRNSANMPVASIFWNDVAFTEDKGHSLLIKSKKFDAVSGQGSMLLPKEIENYEQLLADMRKNLPGFDI